MKWLLIILTSLFIWYVTISALTYYLEYEKEQQFIEIHGVEDNDCWCPDECILENE